MNRMTPLTEQAAALLAEATSYPLTTLLDDELVHLTRTVEAAGRLIDVMRCTVAAEVEQRSAFGLGSESLAVRLGHTKGVHLVEQLTRVSGAEAARRVKLGAAIRPRVGLLGDVLPPAFPHLAASMMTGALGTDAAVAITHTLTQAGRGPATVEELDLAEEALVESAGSNPADYVRQEGRVWRDYLDPDGVEPREDDIHARRALRLGRERNGLTPISGDLDQECAALLRANFSDALSPDARPRFLDENDRVAGTVFRDTAFGRVIENIADPRTREQKQHDILHGLLVAGTRSTGTGPGEMRPLTTVMATITATELKNGAGLGWLEDVGEPLSAATVGFLVCDSGFRLLTAADDGTPLNEGRLKRYFTAAQRRALAARDGGCAWPGCTAPASWTHAHHIVGWAGRNGGTDMLNGVLLCPAHHRLLHRGGFQICMVDGVPHLLAPPSIDPDQVVRPMGRARRRPKIRTG